MSVLKLLVPVQVSVDEELPPPDPAEAAVFLEPLGLGGGGVGTFNEQIRPSLMQNLGSMPLQGPLSQ